MLAYERGGDALGLANCCKSHVGCSGENAIICSPYLAVKVSFRVSREETQKYVFNMFQICSLLVVNKIRGLIQIFQRASSPFHMQSAPPPPSLPGIRRGICVTIIILEVSGVHVKKVSMLFNSTVLQHG